MTLKTFDDLIRAMFDCTNRMPDGTDAELMAWADADAQVQQLRRLLSVYQWASDNPPDGVIGVGIITYAEQKMQEAQQDE